MQVDTTTTTAANNSLLRGLKLTVGDALFHKITSSKILLVGSGGIGCELLKNLALSGFTHVEVIDLDTIDVSNLNRQFLFRSQHVGLPKCQVACDAALAMHPLHTDTTPNNNGSDNGSTNSTTVKYIARHGNVCDNSRFNVNYMKQFSLVLNALDNVSARRRVNRLCLAASIPLIEAGTTGYLGQVTVIDKSANTECYECQPKPTQKVYPICTIRSTPSMPVHTIVWAKELYKLCFGEKVEESMLFEDQSGDEKSTYMDFVIELRDKLANASVGNDDSSSSSSTTNKNGELVAIAGKVITALYHTEIEKQLAMDRFKTAQKVPTSIPTEMIQSVIHEFSSATITIPSKTNQYRETDIPSQKESIIELISCIIDGATILARGEKLLPQFDKDDKLAMRLVTCASNLRSYVFGIEPIQSYYSAKGIAGNIIPAIATTNAIVAGLQVLSAFQILKLQLEKDEKTTSDIVDGDKGEEKKKKGLKDVCKYIYVLRNKSRKGYYLQPTTLPDPNPKCFVCRNAMIHVTLDTTKWTLEMLLRRIIKKELGFMEPSLVLGSSIIYEEGEDIGEDEYKMNVVKVLVNLPGGGIKGGTVVRIEDFTQDLEVDICVAHKSVWEEKNENGENVVVEEEEQFIVGGDKPKVMSSDAKGDNDATSKNNGKDHNDDDDDDDLIEIVTETSNGNGKKRQIIDLDDGDDEDEATGGQKKRARIE